MSESLFEKIVIFDANGVAWTEFHGMPQFSFNKVLTGVAYGFLLQILALAKHYNTNRFVFCWDGRKSFRKERHPWYKEKRAYENKTEEEQEKYVKAVGQIDKMRKTMLPGLGFSQHFRVPGFEADDLIASLVINNPGDFVVVTTDNDLLQLLNNCDIYNHRTKEEITKKSFWRKHHLTPQDWVRVKSIGGCTSDGVPGVPGVAEKSAIQYLRKELSPTSKKFQSIESFEGKTVIERNEWLVKLPLEDTPPLYLNFGSDSFDYDKFLDTCAEFGFRSLLKPDIKSLWRSLFCGEEERPMMGML